MFNVLKKMKEAYKETKKSTLFVYLVLRFLVIVSLVLEIIRGEWNNAFFCVLSLILFTLPYVISSKLKIELPNVLEIIILLFIFAAEILGEIQNFYGIIPYWDTLLHTLNGFLCAAIGIALIDILNKNKVSNLNLSPLFVAIVAFCFSMTVGVLWEFFEYSVDKITLSDSQKDTIVNNVATVYLNEEGTNEAVVVENVNKTTIHSIDKSGNEVETVIEGGYLDIGINDTMKDLWVNFLGAIIFSIIGYLYIQSRDKYKFAEKFIPISKE